ncbi:MAG: succinate dehydrogenase iron-sulfur subunit, partial [Chitinispirillaceae bacterium]|nr:succinate dehydrogenase iron-sulfur subunit [Chitinispirillaceae bacterium]
MTDYSFKIFRFDPSKDNQPYYRTYDLAAGTSWTVLDCLNEIRARLDPTVAFRRSCRGGICGSCAMNINKKNRLACETLVASLRKKVITLKPLPHFEIIKDLVVDLSLFFEAVETVGPFSARHPEADGHRQSPDERKKLDGLYECILCGACTSACVSFWHNNRFPGPAALLKTCRFVLDSRDQSTDERLRRIDRA